LAFDFPIPSPESEQGSFATQRKVSDGNIVKLSSDNLLVFRYGRDVLFFENNPSIVFITSAFFEVKPFKDAFGKMSSKIL